MVAVQVWRLEPVIIHQKVCSLEVAFLYMTGAISYGFLAWLFS